MVVSYEATTEKGGRIDRAYAAVWKNRGEIGMSCARMARDKDIWYGCGWCEMLISWCACSVFYQLLLLATGKFRNTWREDVLVLPAGAKLFSVLTFRSILLSFLVASSARADGRIWPADEVRMYTNGGGQMGTQFNQLLHARDRQVASKLGLIRQQNARTYRTRCAQEGPSATRQNPIDPSLAF